MMRLERRHQPLAGRKAFAKRMVWFTGISLLIVGASLFLGMAGFHWLESLGWLDSLLNASMLLGGMGPVATPQTEIGKLFASFYALFSGMVFLVAFGVLLTPLAHRLFHRFHLDEEENESPRRRRRA